MATSAIQVDFTEAAAPATPAASKVRLYAKTDGKLYTKDDAGAELPVSGAGLTFTPMTAVVIFNGSTTAISVARTLTAAVTGVPANAQLVTGWISMSVDAAANNGNLFELKHQDVDTDNAAVLRHSVASGIVLDQPFTVKCQQSSGAKVYYKITRAAGTITYYMNVSGYWAPA